METRKKNLREETDVFVSSLRAKAHALITKHYTSQVDRVEDSL
jgi:hypothetical protein